MELGPPGPDGTLGVSPRPRPSRQNPARNYCFTLFGGPDGAGFDRILDIFDDAKLPESVLYIVGQFEVSPQTSTVHFQGYLQFVERCRGIVKLQEILGPCHVEIARGTAKQNREYVTKEETRFAGPFELGELITQGKDKAMDVFKAMIKDGASKAELANQCFGPMIRYHKSVDIMSSYLQESPLDLAKYPITSFIALDVDLTHSCLLYGPTGTGKTSYALALLAPALLVRHTEDLLALDSHKYGGVVFDDLAYHDLSFSAALNLADTELPSTVNVRYRTVRLPAGTKRIFTLNDDNLFNISRFSHQEQQAIMRRLKKYEVVDSLVLR